MTSNITTSDAPEAITSTTGPQVLNSHAAQSQQVPAAHQQIQVPHVHHEAQYPLATFELIEHVDEVVAQIPGQQQNGQNLIAGHPNDQPAASSTSWQQLSSHNLNYQPNPFTQQLRNPLLSQFGHLSQAAFQFAPQIGQHHHSQMTQQHLPQATFHFNHQFGNPYVSQQNVQQLSDQQAALNQYTALQAQQDVAPAQHQSTQGVSHNSARGGHALAVQNPQQHGHLTQQIAPAAPSRPICLDVGFKNMLEDQDVAESRDPEECVSEHNHLLIKEKMRLHDLIKQYEYVQRKGGARLSADETYKCFWGALFKNWNSKMPVSNTPTLPTQPKSDIQVQVGHYSTDVSINLPANGRRSSKARKGNAVPIYLSLDLDAEGIHWLYNDKGGTRVRADCVKLLAGLSDTQAKHNVLTHYDTCERNRVCGHNLQLIVEAARRRVQKWAAAGGDNFVELGVECRAPSLIRLVLASEHFENHHKKNCAVADLGLMPNNAEHKGRVN
ncbi:hypothetical protein FBEOM_11885 [Fusarium beomiforme]|uniref:Uncharacterized protein n=1 Tax=Fusarium beomiforme TaxID=44412 RepID=A0A9P5DTY3_9HYPO|nr:hypothetical protein FBEOM_11885 [Fusarium beomiforme]